VRPAQPQPHLSAQSHLSLTACSYLSLCALTGKVIKEAYANVKNGTSSQKEKTIVEKIKKAAESKGVNGGYVVLDQHDLIERNARLNTFRTIPTFNMFVVTRGNTFYISNGTKELQIGSIHTNKGRKFRVLRKLA
jgi:hypothetical protein